MTRRGLLSLFTGHKSHHSHQQQGPTTLMDENISTSETVISKWDLNSSHPTQTPLFSAAREDATQFCHAVHDLQRTMVYFSSSDCVESPKARTQSLVRSQNLMQSAIRRLEKEFYQILSANRECLDPESLSHRSPRSSLSDPDPDPDQDSEDEIHCVNDSISEVRQASEIAMADLRMIAQTMISAGYGRECVKIYNVLRKSIVDEGLYRIGFEKLTLQQIQKLDWEIVELKIRSWLTGAGLAIRTLLAGERILCDQVFEGSDPIRASCFAEIAREAASDFLAFPELIARSKRSPEKLFRILDLYVSVSDLRADIESIFSFESTATVRSQVQSTLSKLTEAAKSTIANFESAIQKDGSKNPVQGGGIHPLTGYVMNYVAFLADYEFPLVDIFADKPIQTQSQSPLSDSISSPLSIQVAWLILVLLCKLDGKAEIYKDVALSYLFLANNLAYIMKKVRSSRLRYLLGEDWVSKHETKVKHYVARFERMGWVKVAEAIPLAEAMETAEEVEVRVQGFYREFEDAVRVQREWVVSDERMKEEVKGSVAELIVPAYRGFYEAFRPVFCGERRRDDVAVLRYAPEDLRARIRQLFGGADSGSNSSSDGGSVSVSGSRSNKSSWWSFTQ